MRATASSWVCDLDFAHPGSPVQAVMCSQGESASKISPSGASALMAASAWDSSRSWMTSDAHGVMVVSAPKVASMAATEAGKNPNRSPAPKVTRPLSLSIQPMGATVVSGTAGSSSSLSTANASAMSARMREMSSGVSCSRHASPRWACHQAAAKASTSGTSASETVTCWGVPPNTSW